MATAASVKTKYRDGKEIKYGTVVAATFTNDFWDIALSEDDRGPGLWYIWLFINANATTSGTLSANAILPDGTEAEEGFFLANQGAIVEDMLIQDYVGAAHVCLGSSATITPIPMVAVPIWNTLRLRIASIGTAGSTNRIDFIAQRM